MSHVKIALDLLVEELGPSAKRCISAESPLAHTAHRRKSHGDFHDADEIRQDDARMSVLAMAIHNLAVEQEHLGLKKEAIQNYQKAVEIAAEHAGGDERVSESLRSALNDARCRSAPQCRPIPRVYKQRYPAWSPARQKAVEQNWRNAGLPKARELTSPGGFGEARLHRLGQRTQIQVQCNDETEIPSPLSTPSTRTRDSMQRHIALRAKVRDASFTRPLAIPHAPRAPAPFVPKDASLLRLPESAHGAVPLLAEWCRKNAHRIADSLRLLSAESKAVDAAAFQQALQRTGLGAPSYYMRELFALYDPEKNGEVPTETLIDLIRTYARLPGTLPTRPSSARAGSARSDFGAAVERPRSAVISAAARKVFQRPLSATAPVPRLLNQSVDKLDKLVCAADGAAQQQCVTQRSPQDKSLDNSTVASSPLTGVRAAAPAVAASSATTAATSLLSRLYTRRASVRELMTEWDVGDTGGLPASEVSMVLTVLGVESSNSEMNALLQMVDPQSSGHVRRDDLLSLLEKSSDAGALLSTAAAATATDDHAAAHVTAHPAERARPSTAASAALMSPPAPDQAQPRLLTELLPSGQQQLDAHAAEARSGQHAKQPESTFGEQKAEIGRGSAALALDENLDSDAAVQAMRDFVVSRGDELLSILYEWDEEGAGHVTRREFRHSLKMLGLSAAKLHLDALCDVVDAARSDLVRISAVQQLVGNTAGIARESAPKRAVHQQHVADAKSYCIPVLTA